jgi:hypothetical protein
VLPGSAAWQCCRAAWWGPATRCRPSGAGRQVPAITYSWRIIFCQLRILVTLSLRQFISILYSVTYKSHQRVPTQRMDGYYNICYLICLHSLQELRALQVLLLLSVLPLLCCCCYSYSRTPPASHQLDSTAVTLVPPLA